jgi:hypothetical protein
MHSTYVVAIPVPAMDRFSDFRATREIAEISVHYHNISGGVGGGTASIFVKNS